MLGQVFEDMSGYVRISQVQSSYDKLGQVHVMSG
jgi:hypothetical protein